MDTTATPNGVHATLKLVGEPVCDDCLADRAALASRQAARRLAMQLARSNAAYRARATCVMCSKLKYVTALTPIDGAPLPPVAEPVAPVDSEALVSALAAVQALGVGIGLTETIARLETAAIGLDRIALPQLLRQRAIDDDVLSGALLIKELAGQIDIVVHTVGILASLPHILQAGELVQSLSLGAGNTGRAFDLETDRQVAEFKFINWRGGAEAIRQNHTFVDMFNLASAVTTKRRVLYLLGTEIPLRFFNGKRSIGSVLSHHEAVGTRFAEAYNNRYTIVRDWFMAECQAVAVVDLRLWVPGFGATGMATARED
jgi:hypothetical protein